MTRSVYCCPDYGQFDRLLVQARYDTSQCYTLIVDPCNQISVIITQYHLIPAHGTQITFMYTIMISVTKYHCIRHESAILFIGETLAIRVST